LNNRIVQYQEKVYNKHYLFDIYDITHQTYPAMGRNDKTVKQLVIPFSLDKRKKRIGFWANEGCFENDVEETMGNWNDWDWSDKYIEFYQNKKLIL
jgi:hypothetical protein